MYRARLRHALQLGLLIALAVNLFLIAAHFWSRDGQRSVVEVQSIDGAFRVETDGRRVLPSEATDPYRVAAEAPPSGTVRLVLPVATDVMPQPSGIDSITVRDGNGKVLFSDNFDSLDPASWKVVSGRFAVKDGVLYARDLDRDNTIDIRDANWSDYTVAVTYRNGQGGTIGVNVAEGGGAYYNFDLIRDFPNFLFTANAGQHTATIYGGFVRTAPSQSLRSIAAIFTESYPYLLLALLAGVGLTLLVSQTQPIWPSTAFAALKRRLAWLHLAPLVLGLLLVFAFGTTLAINDRYYSFLPHVPDEVAYLFQAHLLAHLKIKDEIPPAREFFYFYEPTFLYERNGDWSSFYPFGHPMVLALGALFGAVWAVPSLIGAASVGLTYAVGRRLFDARTGIVAAALLAASPFFLMQSSNFMSHNTGAFYMLASLFFIIKRDRPLLFGAFAGLFFGLGVNTRPLNMIALVLPYGALMLSFLVLEKEKRRHWLEHSAAFVAGIGLALAAMAAYNYGITGDPFKATYAGNQGGSSDLFGFKNGHHPDIGIRNEQAQTTALAAVFNGWPGFAVFGLLMAPFVLGTRNRYDWFLLAAAALPMGVYLFYRYSGVYEGPRYWYEEIPFLMLLSARGAEVAAAFLVSAVAWLRGRLKQRWASPHPFAGLLVVYVVVVALTVRGTGGWLLGWNKQQDAPLVPYRASAIEGIFGLDDRLVKLADKTPLKHALVLVKPCGFFISSSCYASVFLRNLPGFDGDVVWARYIEGRNQEVIDAFPGRKVYVATWDEGASIRPYDPQTDQ